MTETGKTFTLPDGRTLAWRETGFGPPLVLLHGWAMSSAIFAELAAELGRDFRLLLPDLRGHGASAPAEGYALEDFAADLSSWLDALGLERIALGGWSLGGMVALTLARQQPERIGRLILLATTPRFVADHDWPHGLPDAQVRILSRNYQRAPEATRADFFLRQFVAGEIPPAQIAGSATGVALPVLSAALGGLETLRHADLRPRLATIAQPTLILHGSEDPVIPCAAGAALAAALPAAELLPLAGLGHAPFLSRPDLCIGALRRFLP